MQATDNLLRRIGGFKDKNFEDFESRRFFLKSVAEHSNDQTLFKWEQSPASSTAWE